MSSILQAIRPGQSKSDFVNEAVRAYLTDPHDAKQPMPAFTVGGGSAARAGWRRCLYCFDCNAFREYRSPLAIDCAESGHKIRGGPNGFVRE